MGDFVQKVFDEISLEDNIELWMSTDDNLLQDRLEFLACYPQTMFTEQLFNTEKKVKFGQKCSFMQRFQS